MEQTILGAYIQKNGASLLRQAEGGLRHPFIVPGSVYSSQLWDWDCWLTNIALRQAGTEGLEEHETGCVLNFLEHMKPSGRVPVSVQANGELPAATEGIVNSHKPCLAQHAAFIVQQRGGDINWLAPAFPQLLRYVDYYMEHCRHSTGLYFWINDCAIGVDNDPCTFYRPEKSSGSIFLNCLMYRELEAVCRLGELLGADVRKYALEKEHLRDAVRLHCYDEKDGFYYSVDLNLLPVDPENWLHSGAPRHWDCLIQRIGVWSGFLAMWCGIATPEQARRMVRENLLDEKSFWAPFGVRSLAAYEKMYTVAATGNPSCWLGPVWGIVQYFVFRGLVRYGFTEEARTLAEQTVRLFEQDIAACGQMHEYYNPETGAPVNNPGFQSWNLLALNMQAWLSGDPVITEF